MRRFIEFVPLFNFDADGRRIDLDDHTWLAPLDDVVHREVVHAVDQPDTVVSRDILAALSYGLFHRFTLADPAVTQPPDQDLEWDARVIFKILKPEGALTTGYHRYYSEDGSPSSGARRTSEFRWPGPPYVVGPSEVARLPGLWRELRALMSHAWLWHSRFFHTFRVRLWRASHDQDHQQRLLDHFIAIEALLLRPSEQWGHREKKNPLPFGPRRLAMLLDPASPAEDGPRFARVRTAHDQRNTVAHGIDRGLFGFDGTVGTFGELACEVERWAPFVLHRMLRLLHHVGSKDAALDRLDALAADVSVNHATANQLLTPVI
jgi:hypothetical protein